MITKLKSDTEAAKKDVSKRSKRSLDKQSIILYQKKFQKNKS